MSRTARIHHSAELMEACGVQTRVCVSEHEVDELLIARVLDLPVNATPMMNIRGGRCDIEDGFKFVSV